MNLRSVPCELWTLYAENGDPLLLYGKDAEGYLMLWPTVHIPKHRMAFLRWCWKNVSRFRGCRATLCLHPLDAKTERWAKWLGVTIEAGRAVV